MRVLLRPRAAEPAATTRPPDPAPLPEELATLRRENAALRVENGALRAANAALQVESAVLHERVRELEVRLGQTPANSSRPRRQIRPGHQRGRRHRPRAGSVAASRAIAGSAEPYCRSSR